MYKLVVSDLDGTLLDDNHILNPYTKKVVQKLCERDDIHFIIATGRNYVDAVRIKKDLGIDVAMITSNGATLYDKNGNMIFKHSISSDKTDELFKIDYKKYSSDIIMNVVCENDWYITEKLPKDHIINEWSAVDYAYKVVDMDFIIKQEITKVFYIGNHEKLLELEKEIISILGDFVNLAFTLPFCLEIFPKEATKAKALIEISKLKNLPLHNSIAFGDGFNDLELLTSVTKGYIMENASPKLKNELKSFEIIDANYNNGVAKKLIQLFSLEI